MSSSVIIRNPGILSGEPVFRGTRAPFKCLTDYLEHERTVTEFSTIALSRPETHKPNGQKPGAQQTSALPSSAQLAFARLKTLAGNWKGHTAMGPGMNAPVRVSLSVTSGGDALMHEMVPEGRANDPSNGADDPVTMFYIDGDRLLLTHIATPGRTGPVWQASCRQMARP